MIKVKKGETEIKGDLSIVLTELTGLIKCLNEGVTEKLGAEKARKRIMKAVEMGFYTDEEVHSEFLKALFKVILKEGTGEKDD